MGAWTVATIALLLLAFSAVSGRIERSVVTPAIFFTSAGLLAAPVLGLIDLHIGGEPIKLLAEATRHSAATRAHGRARPGLRQVPMGPVADRSG